MSDGARINQECTLGARVIEAAERLYALEKLARRTPAKTLLAERRRVEAARAAVPLVLAELRSLLCEHAAIRAELGRDARCLSDEYLAALRRAA